MFLIFLLCCQLELLMSFDSLSLVFSRQFSLHQPLSFYVLVTCFSFLLSSLGMVTFLLLQILSSFTILRVYLYSNFIIKPFVNKLRMKRKWQLRPYHHTSYCAALLSHTSGLSYKCSLSPSHFLPQPLISSVTL